jgi:hypothetical protein
MRDTGFFIPYAATLRFTDLNWYNFGMESSDNPILKQELTEATLLSDIEPIEEGGMVVENREDLRSFVEAPLLEACQRFFDKGIKTVFSSANKKDVRSGYAHIALDFESLSPVNQKIAMSLGKEGIIHGSRIRKGIYLEIPITETSILGEIKKKALALVDKFENQSI